MAPSHHVICIGNAIVDIISHADDAFLEDNGLVKGAMTLIDADRAESLYERMGPALEMSGGSAGNTAAGIASLGGKAGYIGKVCEDQLGRFFGHDIRAAGVTFATAPITGAPPTARSLIVVTPDAQRTMNTYLGACVELTPADIDESLIADGEITYVEGYLWDSPSMKESVLAAARFAHKAERRFSLTLSDPFCVDRHRDTFRDLVDGHIDILFANEHELMALYETETLDDAMTALRGRCDIAAITRGPKGSTILAGTHTYDVPAEPVARVADTTGAGDLYAAGFLYGLTTGQHPAECGRLGSIAAAEIISHVGARPETPLSSLIDSQAA